MFTCARIVRSLYASCGKPSDARDDSARSEGEARRIGGGSVPVVGGGSNPSDEQGRGSHRHVCKILPLTACRWNFGEGSQDAASKIQMNQDGSDKSND
jgi:hypothetical protein